MPKNCTADVEAAIDHIDKTFTTGSTAQINALKAQFGMQNVTHWDDVAAALRAPFWVWQDLQVCVKHERWFTGRRPEISVVAFHQCRSVLRLL